MPTPPYYGQDDIYALAAQAGMVPAEAPPEAPQDPYANTMTGGLTPPDLAMASPAPPEMPPPIPGSSVATSGSVSTRGFDAAKYGAMSPTDRELAGANARSTAEIQARSEPVQAQLTAAGEAEKAALRAKADAVSAQATAQGEDDLAASVMNESFRQEEQRLNSAATAEANQSKTNYIAALADLRASRVDPSQLWRNMSGGTQFGMQVAAFVTDFLGAKGIHTSAMETFNKAIDRNIDSQIQAIKTKGEVADGFKSLWYMQRSQASSEAEARTRVRGFVLDGAKSAAAAHMAKYNAGLATAQGQAAIAAIDKEQAANTFQVFKDVESSITAAHSQNIDNINNKRNNAQAAYATASANKRATDAAAAAAPQNQDPRTGLMFDSGTHAATMIRKGDTKDEDWSAINKEQADVETLQNLSSELQGLVREYGNLGPAARTRWADVNDQRIQAVRGELLEKRSLLLTGKVANATEQKIIGAGTPEQQFLGMLDASPTIAQTSRHLGDAFDARAHKFAWELPANDPKRRLTVGTSPNNPGLRTENVKVEAGTDKPVRTATDVVFERMATPDTAKSAPDSLYKDTGIEPEAVARAWEHFGTPHAARAQAEFDKAAADRDNEGKDRARETKDTLGGSPPSYAVEVAALRDQAASGDTRALNKLVELATKDPSNPSNDDPNLNITQETLRKAWAQYELHSYLAETDSGKKLSKPRPPSESITQPGPSAVYEPQKTKYYQPQRRK